MYLRILHFSLLIAAFQISGFDRAYAGDSGYYLRIDGGYAFPGSAGFEDRGDFTDCSICSSGATVIDDLEASPLFGVGLGYRWSSTLRSDLTYSYRENNLNHFDPVNGINNTYQSNIRSHTLMVSGYYDFIGVSERMTPFVGAGVGVTHSSMSPVTQAPAGYGPSAREVDPGGTKIDFSWQVTGGFDYALSERLSVGVAYRFFDGGKLRTQRGMTTTNFLGDYISAGIKGHLTTQDVLVSLRVNF